MWSCQLVKMPFNLHKGYELQLCVTPLLCVFIQPQFIANCIVEIKKELKQENVMIKANAVSKLTYVCVH